MLGCGLDQSVRLTSDGRWKSFRLKSVNEHSLRDKFGRDGSLFSLVRDIGRMPVWINQQRTELPIRKSLIRILQALLGKNFEYSAPSLRAILSNTLELGGEVPVERKDVGADPPCCQLCSFACTMKEIQTVLRSADAKQYNKKIYENTSCSLMFGFGFLRRV